MRTRVIIGIVAGIFFLCFISACFRGCGSADRSRRPTASRSTEPATRVAPKAEAEAKTEKSAPREKSSVEKAFEGVVENGGIMVFGEKNVKEYNTRKEAERKRAEEAGLLIRTAEEERAELAAKKAEEEIVQEERLRIKDRIKDMRDEIAGIEWKVRNWSKGAEESWRTADEKANFRRIARGYEEELEKKKKELLEAIVASSGS